MPKVQVLPGPHSGSKVTMIPGDTMSRSMGQYGKGHDPMAALMSAGTTAPAGADLGKAAVRDPVGGLRKHPKLGGMGTGPNGAIGSPRGYGKTMDNA